MRRRDDLFESDPPEEKSTAGEQSEDFFFEEKEDDFPQAETLKKQSSVKSSVESKPAKSGSKSRVPLLLLLLIVLLGAAYFFMGDLLFGPAAPPQPAVVKSQPQRQKIPVRKEVQQEQKAVKEVVMPAEEVASVPAEEKDAPREEVAVVVEAPVEKAVEPATEEPVEAKQKSVESQPVVAETPAEESVVAEKESSISPVVEESKTEEKPEVAVAAVKAPYVLQIGAYVLDSNMKRTLEMVESLGYEPFVLEGKKAVTMTRLRVGTYPEKVAREKLSELQQMIPSAFLLHEGDQMVLYAGSYYGLDHARVQADLIYPHKIHVDEEQIDITIPIRTVRFGDFKDYSAAGIMAEKAKAAGLETLIVKQN